jgi:hypothetical protein
MFWSGNGCFFLKIGDQNTALVDAISGKAFHLIHHCLMQSLLYSSINNHGRNNFTEDA